MYEKYYFLERRKDDMQEVYRILSNDYFFSVIVELIFPEYEYSNFQSLEAKKSFLEDSENILKIADYLNDENKKENFINCLLWKKITKGVYEEVDNDDTLYQTLNKIIEKINSKNTEENNQSFYIVSWLLWEIRKRIVSLFDESKLIEINKKKLLSFSDFFEVPLDVSENWNIMIDSGTIIVSYVWVLEIEWDELLKAEIQNVDDKEKSIVYLTKYWQQANNFEAKRYAREFMKRNYEKGLYYHNRDHVIDVLDRVRYLCYKEKVDDKKFDLISIAAIFHDIAYDKEVDDHEEVSAKVAEWFMTYKWYSSEDIEFVKNLILSTKPSKEPRNLSEMIIKDADVDNFWRNDFSKKWDLLKSELEELFWKKIPRDEFFQNSLRFAKEFVKFHTSTQITERNPTLQQNLSYIRKFLEID